MKAIQKGSLFCAYFAIVKSTQALFDFIEKYVAVDTQIRDFLNQHVSIKRYEKGDQLVKAGQVCTQLQFVLSGVYRVYHIHDGKEVSSYFNTDYRNPFVASFVSLLTGRKSNEYVECLLPGELLSISYEKWQELYEQSHELSTFGRLMAEFNYVLAVERIESLQYKSATDRYETFMQLYPALLNQIPHHYIASYLGITPESLSRIRKNSVD